MKILVGEEYQVWKLVVSVPKFQQVKFAFSWIGSFDFYVNINFNRLFFIFFFKKSALTFIVAVRTRLLGFAMLELCKSWRTSPARCGAIEVKKYNWWESGIGWFQVLVVHSLPHSHFPLHFHFFFAFFWEVLIFLLFYFYFYVFFFF